MPESRITCYNTIKKNPLKLISFGNNSNSTMIKSLCIDGETFVVCLGHLLKHSPGFLFTALPGDLLSLAVRYTGFRQR